jgi:adenylate kinase family enzyme
LADRILIFGNSGAGTSALAQTLAGEHALAHLDLDPLVWEQADAPARRALAQSRVEIEKFTSTNAGWVIEGTNADLLTMLLDECSELVFLNPGAEAYKSSDDEYSLSSHRWLFDRFNGVKREFTTLS